MGIKWFQLVDAAGAAKADVDNVSVDTAMVTTLRKAVKAEYGDALLAGIPSVKLVVYANRAAFDAKRAPLGPADSIASLGESPTDPLIVQTPPSSSPTTQRRWFQLVDAAGVAITGVDSVSIETVLVTTLRDAAKMKHADGLLGGIAPSNLTVYADVAAMKARQTPLDEDESIESMGKSRQDPLIV